MNADQLHELAGNPNHIPGIYNYCDRWCERCPFTSRCLTFAMGEFDEMTKGRDSNDPRNEAFWERLSETLAAAAELLIKSARERGIDLDSIEAEAQAAASENLGGRERVYADKLTIAAEAYGAMVTKWFEEAAPSFQAIGVDTENAFDPELTKTDLPEHAASMIDAIEILRWYQYQIAVKLMRGISGTYPRSNDYEEYGLIEPDVEADEEEWKNPFGTDDEGDPEWKALFETTDDGEGDEAPWTEDLDEDDPEDGPSDFGNDSDGSVKVALIAIDRSIAAWSHMLHAFPEREDRIIDIALHLERVRREAERRFPNARAFVRPGFDDNRPGGSRRERG